MDLQDIVAAGAAFFVSILTWFFNEQSKRADDLYKQKEARYLELISCLKEFHAPSSDDDPNSVEPRDRKPVSKKLSDELLRQVQLCWLYCSDDVIRKAHAFLDAVHLADGRSDILLEKAGGELLVAIRKDLNRNTFNKLFNMWGGAGTRLKPDDFKRMA